MMKSSFHGKIVELPGIYVDNFENAAEQDARAYFLSHYHSDHTQGLHSQQLLEVLSKKNVTIYATELTTAIIEDDKKDERIMKHVKGLKMGESLITLPSIPENNLPEFYFTVTLIPAGHCAGSTMFLFKTSVNILFTGDFRINITDLPKYKYLHDKDEPIKLQALYLDTTFLDTKYEHFPKRSDSVDEMLFEMKQWLDVSDTNAIALHTSAKYGYEFVFNEIFKHMNIKVFVSSERWRFYSTIQHLVTGVTNNENSKVHLCKNRSENTSHKSCTSRSERDFLFIHLSAMKWENFREAISSVRHVTAKRMDVCFATHCSKREIEHFVDYLKPIKVIGFPNYFNVTRKINYNIDSDIVFKKKIKRDKKVDAAILKLMFE